MVESSLYRADPVPARCCEGSARGATIQRVGQNISKDRSALLLAAIVQSSDDAIVSKDLDGTITSWNPAAERMFGYTAAEAVGRSIRIIIPAERQAEEDEVLSRIGRGLSVDHFETIRRRKDGSLIPISLTVSPVRDEDGQVIGASKVARDISQRLTFERALADAEAGRADLHERLLSLVAASASLLGSPRLEDVLPAIVELAGNTVAADGYAVWRRNSTTGMWHIASHSGVSVEFANAMIPDVQAEPTRLREPLAADDIDAVPLLERRREALRKEGIRSLLVIPLGSPEAGSATLAFYFRQPHRFNAIEIDTARALGNLAGAALHTADLHAQQKQREHQALFLARAASALAGSLDYRQTLRTLAWLAVPHIADWCAVDMLTSQGTLERLAVAHPDATRVNQAEQFHKKYPPTLDGDGGIGKVLRTGQSELVERLTDEMIDSLARSDEHRADVRALGIVSFMIVPLRTRRGTIGVITFVAAESGRQYTAADLRFAETVADRASVAIENVWAYEDARLANQLKDEFLATLSHELRTPLNAMLGYTRMLKAGAVPPERRESALEVIERNGGTLAQILEDLLDVSRIISGKLRLEIGDVDADGLLADAISTVQPGADAKGIKLQVATNAPGLVLHADRDRLQQVLWNLLTNAVKFTPPGGRISVGVTTDADAVQFTVSDTGRGIDASLLPHVFERFRQGDSRIGREHGGLGLGLSIARHIVEMHGGTIWAESEGPNKGATFRVRLPIVAVTAL